MWWASNIPGMPKSRPPTPRYGRFNIIVNLNTAARVDELRGALKREGMTVSISAIVEAAVLELLERRNVRAVLEKHGLRNARREWGS
jgi:hypothetical protein